MLVVVATRVRIIDDDTDMTGYLRVALEHEGFDVDTINVVQPELLTEAAWTGVDVVICDLMMPTDGREVLAWLAANAPHVRRLAWSAMSRDLAGPVEADGYLNKPATLPEIMAAIGVGLG